MEITKNFSKKYPDVSFQSGYLHNKNNHNYLYFRQDNYNCGAVLRNTIDKDVGKELENAFQDFCSINGITLISGTCSLENYKSLLKGYGYEIVYQYESNREGEVDYRDGERILMEGTPMVMFVKHIKDPYLKGYGLYTGELNK